MIEKERKKERERKREIRSQSANIKNLKVCFNYIWMDVNLYDNGDRGLIVLVKILQRERESVREGEREREIKSRSANTRGKQNNFRQTRFYILTSIWVLYTSFCIKKRNKL